jgi:lipopolysaccharide transport system ATP-binding protein
MLLHFAGEALNLPDGAFVGILSDDTNRVVELLAQITEPGVTRFAYTLDLLDACARLELETELERLRRAGAVALVASHNEELLRVQADELWWVRDGRLVLRGSAEEVLPAYRRYAVNQFRKTAVEAELHPKFRRGDGRAELLSLDLMSSAGERTSTLVSGEEAAIRVAVRYAAAVEDPVVGIMIRTRIGMEVYGTNTELERVQVGPCRGGDVRVVEFRFRCELCPGRYTLTAASHDPDGVWHDWMEDAAAFTVSADRYTAGVANLRARVSVFSGSRE